MRPFMLVLALAVVILAGCQPGSVAAQDLIRPAKVERIDVVVLDTEPAQVRVVAHGYLPDGCTTVAGIEQSRDGSVFHVFITTRRPAAAMCTQAIIRFEEVFPLKVDGAPAGDYTVDVNGKTQPLRLK